MPHTLRLLVAEGETEAARAARRAREGRSSGESYLDTLRSLAPDARFQLAYPADPGAGTPEGQPLDAFDGVFLTGSPLHMYEDTPEVRRQLDFMRAVFASGTPAFGSCAGLHLATAAAGGSVRANRSGDELPIARNIRPTPSGAQHALLQGRPACYDALAVHTDEVERLPDGAILLATNGADTVQAAEIRHGGGIFWGVQYHPELPLAEIAGALREQADSVVQQGRAATRGEVGAWADRLAKLGAAPWRDDLAEQLAVDRQVTDPALRTTELRNFLRGLVQPTRAARDRPQPR